MFLVLKDYMLLLMMEEYGLILKLGEEELVIMENFGDYPLTTRS